MAQTLFVKVDDGEGGSKLKEIHVLRSWQESDGRQLFLHTNGIYGYKDESPVRTRAELDIIIDPTQKKMANVWWDRVGKDMSAGFYQEREAEIEERQMKGLNVVVKGESSDLDSITYIRRPIKDKRKKAFSEPSTWPEFDLDFRPDWWGKASVIELGVYRYEQILGEEEEEKENRKEETGKSEEVVNF